MSDRIPSGFIEHTLHFIQQGQDGDIVTSFGWEGDSSITQEQAEAIAAAAAPLMGNLSHLCTLSSHTIELGSSDPVNVVLTVPDTVDGEAGGEVMPPNNAFLLQKRTNLGGRRNRGRNYLPGVSEGAVNGDGTLAPGIASGISTNVSDYFDTMAGLGYSAALFHQSAPFSPTQVSVVTVSSTIATQRKRLARS